MSYGPITSKGKAIQAVLDGGEDSNGLLFELVNDIRNRVFPDITADELYNMKKDATQMIEAYLASRNLEAHCCVCLVHEVINLLLKEGE